MRSLFPILCGGLFFAAVAGCGKIGPMIPQHADPASGPTASDTSVTLDQARKGFKTTLTRTDRTPAQPPQPPAGVFQLVRYDAAPGKMAAYVTPDPKDGKKHPAIVWVTGGDCNSIDEGSWADSPAANDQSAAQYRKAGLVMMFPALRGGSGSPGVKEWFLGEIDDVLAAAEYLRKQPYVDPDRVYLGGHSTGGTVALLAAEGTNPFRAVFAFGPVDDVAGYGPEYNAYAPANGQEARLRSPGHWLHGAKKPTFVIEGGSRGNADCLQNMARAAKNPNLHFLEVKAADHFSVLAPVNKLIAAKLMQDTGPACNVGITPEEVSKAFGR